MVYGLVYDLNGKLYFCRDPATPSIKLEVVDDYSCTVTMKFLSIVDGGFGARKYMRRCSTLPDKPGKGIGENVDTTQPPVNFSSTFLCS